MWFSYFQRWLDYNLHTTLKFVSYGTLLLWQSICIYISNVCNGSINSKLGYSVPPPPHPPSFHPQVFVGHFITYPWNLSIHIFFFSLMPRSPVLNVLSVWRHSRCPSSMSTSQYARKNVGMWRYSSVYYLYWFMAKC